MKCPYSQMNQTLAFLHTMQMVFYIGVKKGEVVYHYFSKGFYYDSVAL